MAIEFRCNECQKLLRIPDEHAGKSAQCPACGHISQVPAASTTAASFEPEPSAVDRSLDGTIAHDSAADANSSAEPGTVNPYAPPRTAIPEVQRPTRPRLPLPLASRWKRLGGSILDGLIYILAMVPGFIGLMIFDNGPDELALAAAIFMFGCMIAVAVYNWYLITVSGQSIAKRMLGMRIVTTGGELPGFLMGVLVRQWIPIIINQVCNLFSLVDAVFIFGQEKRCLHDYMANTVVIDTDMERIGPSNVTPASPFATTTTPTWNCPTCGTAVPATWNKCSSCGEPRG